MNRDPVINIDNTQYISVWLIASLKRLNSLRKHLKPKDGASIGPEVLEWEVRGAMAEFAASKYTGLNWHIGSFVDDSSDTGPKKPDVGHIHVRSCRPGDNLIIKKSDPSDEIFLLVEVNEPKLRCEVMGWCYPGDIIDDKYLKSANGRPEAYYIPPCDLRPLAELDLAPPKVETL